jgi:hypothetical protein
MNGQPRGKILRLFDGDIYSRASIIAESMLLPARRRENLPDVFEKIDSSREAEREDKDQGGDGESKVFRHVPVQAKVCITRDEIKYCNTNKTVKDTTSDERNE